MLSLITFPPGFDEPSLSPFCVKAMILLKMSGQDWRPEWASHPKAGPLGKLPALRTPDGVIPDSALIQEWLTGQGADLFPGMDRQQRAQAHALMRMVEDSLHHGLIHDRWARDDAWSLVKPVYFAAMPAPVRAVVPNMLRKGVVKGLHRQGFARYSEAQRLTFMQADLDALSVQLGDQPYLFGDQPCAADASALPFLSMLAGLPCDTPLRAAVRANDRLMEYVARGRAALYPKLSLWSAAAA
ncbi:glutathione S-transferase family protein [Tropicibacter oceani]|uniref:Glutathione S-transferase family protein n=1 Tax=Tropicibacter oceani TaxID=3058420 RepID=A0ABY8QKJ4_9RHOB|nr:glutathione S-transferase family protein [Tropicibacter oceani]WGW05137.1 glutathione S-transferase family protein [Tropicibacter oceani]